MAHPKHQSVRQRFDYRCGYCGVSDTDAGGELTIDHYQPVSKGGDDSDGNLVYACWRCNLNKNDFWPNTQQAAHGLRLLHPLRDDLTSHVQENESGLLEGLTDTERVHILILQLNRLPLVAYRLRAKEAQRRDAQSALFAAAIRIQAQRIQELNRYLAQLSKKMLDETDSD